ncbi:MAG: tetratricopeptide repeat protein [Bacteroidales bacterium]|nr:tetratricopeptide repeat protein [Bacteroidales bacterium]MDD5912459.1 tetratricopeptide repeat protein [Bacteroidales bacterium]
MKKFLLIVAAAVMSAVTVSAQDLAQATETYNNGAMELQMGNNALALEHFQNALSMAETLGDDAIDLVNNCKKAICSTSLSIAKELYNAKDFEAAITAFEKAKSVAETYGEAEIAEEAAELTGQTWKLKYNTDAKAAMSAKNYDEAAANFKKVLELDPDNGNTAIQLAQAYMKSSKLDDALEALETAKANGQEANANKMISQIFLMKAQASLKAKNYQAVMDLAAKSNEALENANAYKLAASAAQKLGKNNDCIALYEKYLEISPKAKDAAGVICTVAVLYQQAGNKAKAKEYYEKIVNDPQFGATAAEQLKTL